MPLPPGTEEPLLAHTSKYRVTKAASRALSTTPSAAARTVLARPEGVGASSSESAPSSASVRSASVRSAVRAPPAPGSVVRGAGTGAGAGRCTSGVGVAAGRAAGSAERAAGSAARAAGAASVPEAGRPGSGGGKSSERGASVSGVSGTRYSVASEQAETGERRKPSVWHVHAPSRQGTNPPVAPSRPLAKPGGPLADSMGACLCPLVVVFGWRRSAQASCSVSAGVPMSRGCGVRGGSTR